MASLGFERDYLERAGSGEIADMTSAINRVASRIKSGADILDVLFTCLSQFNNLQPVANWALQYLATHGQPLTANPSRLEQSLAICMAQRQGKIEISERDSKYVRPGGLIVLDDYLSAQPEWADLWRKVVVAIGGRPDETVGRTVPVDRTTLPFLVAELMQFWKPGESGTALVERLRIVRPGIAFLPFCILGQYRAAAAWFYTGSFSENRDLIKHVSTHAHRDFSGVEPDWLAETVESAFLNNSSFDILSAIHQFEGPLNCPMSSCDALHSAFGTFWYCRSITLIKGDRRVNEIETSSRNVLLDQPLGNVVIKFDLEPEVVELLGFDKVQFECPLLVPELAESAQRDVQRMVDSLIAPAARRLAHSVQVKHDKEVERSRAQKEQEENSQKFLKQKLDQDMVKAIGTTGHDFANSLTDLIAISSIEDMERSHTSALVRLSMLNNRARQLECHSSLMRNLLRGVEEIALEDWCQTTLPPSQEDMDFWVEYLRSVVVCTAYSERWRILSSKRNRPLALDIRYCFTFGEQQDAKKVQEIRVANDPSVLTLIPEIVSRDFPPWPLNTETKGDRDKLGENGRLMMLLWGPLEILRNACRASSALLYDRPAPQREIDVNFSISQDEHGWCLRTSIDNDVQIWSSAPRPEQISSLARIKSYIRGADFKREVLGSTRVRYIYEWHF